MRIYHAFIPHIIFLSDMPQMAARRIETRRVRIGGGAADGGLRMFTRVLECAQAAAAPSAGGAAKPRSDRGEDGRDRAETVVLVHGLGVSGAYWMPTALRLAERFRVLVPDLPGFGDSDRPRRVLDIGELAAALASWMDAMEIDRAPLVANSLGCQVAVRLTMERPERVPRLILQGMTIDPEARSAPTQMARLLADAFVEPPSLLPLIVRDYLKCGPRRLIGTLQHILEDPIAHNLTRVEVPALVVRGDRDPIVPQRWAEESARLLPNGRLIVIPRAAHALNFGRPEEFTRVICDYLGEARWARATTPPREPSPGA